MLTKILLETIRRERLIAPNSHVFVGFSGGPDSVALLVGLSEILGELECSLVAAHVDHGVRSNSLEDKKFCEEFARDRGIPFVSERIDWGAGGVPHSNVEATLRDRRYALLHKMAANAPKSERTIVAVGHHTDDRLETFLVQLLRGAGPRGLSNPRYQRADGVIRPLLDVSRAQIVEFLETRSLPFLRDPTNEDGSNLRSRIRADVVPLLERENPYVAGNVARTARILASVEDLLEALAREAREGLVCSVSSRDITLDGRRAPLYHGMVLSTLLRQILEEMDPEISPGHDLLMSLAESWKSGKTGTRDVSGSVRIQFRGGDIRLTRSEELVRKPPLAAELPVPGELCWGGAQGVPRFRVRVDRFGASEARPRDYGSDVAWVDEKAVSGPLEVRSRRPGDRYRPLGHPGSVKVQDLFVNQKVPRDHRDFVPIVIDREGILWIPGCRIRERARITESTSFALRLEAVTTPGGNAREE